MNNKKHFSEIKIKKDTKPITHIVKMGGYWYINKFFPFIHFEEEYLILGNETKLYRWEPK